MSQICNNDAGFVVVSGGVFIFAAFFQRFISSTVFGQIIHLFLRPNRGRSAMAHVTAAGTMLQRGVRRVARATGKKYEFL